MHAHDHGDRLAADRRRLGIALVLIAASWSSRSWPACWPDSLALLADAGHMLSDAGSLGLALFARLARRSARRRRSAASASAAPRSSPRSANGVALVVVAIWIFVEAGQRLADPPERSAAGCSPSAWSAWPSTSPRPGSWRGAGRESLNVRAALRHVLADLLGSVGVIVAGDGRARRPAGATPTRSRRIADRRARARQLVADPARVGRRSCSRRRRAGIDAERGRAARWPRRTGVREVHDLHIWTITSGFPALSAHVLVDAGRRLPRASGASSSTCSRERFGLEHTTLQVEHAAGDSGRDRA